MEFASKKASVADQAAVYLTFKISKGNYLQYVVLETTEVANLNEDGFKFGLGWTSGILTADAANKIMYDRQYMTLTTSGATISHGRHIYKLFNIPVIDVNVVAAFQNDLGATTGISVTLLYTKKPLQELA